MVSVEKKKGPSPFRNMDWLMLAIVIALQGIGLLVLRSVAMQMGTPDLYTKQLMAAVIGFVAMVIILFFDYMDFHVLGFFAYVLTTVLLVLALTIGHGYDEVGMNGWLLVGPFSFQPSELAKITLVLVAAFFFERLYEKKNILNVGFLVVLSFLPVGLILKQPDFGTAVVCVFVFFVMLFVWGIKYRYLLIGLVSIGAAAIPVWVYVLPKVLEEFQMKRILSFINPAAYSKDAAYQVRMAIRAIGSGKDTVDLSRDYASNWVPARETDMIFAALGEKLGFYGAVATVLLFTVLLLRCIYIATFCRERYGSYLAIGLMAIFFAHFLENVGMNLGLLPVTGIPLPFISSGGSSLIANYIAAGILMNVSMRRKTNVTFS